jgi:hypothetical protein
VRSNQTSMSRNLRKALSLTAFLFLLAALFPIQKRIVPFPAPESSMTALTVRQMTFFLVGIGPNNDGIYSFYSETDQGQ